MASLTINNETISTCLGIVSKNIFYYYIPMIISKNYNNFKPGKILMLEILDWCTKNQIEYFDFGLGMRNIKKILLINLYRFIDILLTKVFRKNVSF